jgi:hypothetical protein
MRNSRLARCLFCPVLLLAVVSGCQTFHVYRPVAVQVRDAETKQPIPGAEVRISYPLMQDSLTPPDSFGLTNGEGITRLRATPYGKAGITLKATAKGYLPEEQGVLVETIKEIKPAYLFESTDHRPVNFVLEAYAEPPFSVEFIVPTGYRGLVKAEVKIQEDAPLTPGQRCFSYPVSPDGVVQVKGSAILRRIPALEYRAKYADGAPLKDETDATKVGFRWLNCEGNEQYFVVGTQSEYDNFRRHFIPKEGSDENRPSKGGKGGGGRHRRGSQISSSE